MHLCVIALPRHPYREEIQQAVIAQKTIESRRRVLQRNKFIMIENEKSSSARSEL